MCQFYVDKQQFEERFGHPFDGYFTHALAHLDMCQSDGLLENHPSYIEITTVGQQFVRTICMGFDAYLKDNTSALFSKTV